jgi:hypothetical protein
MEGNVQEIRALRPMDSRSRIGVRDRLRGNDGANRRRTDLPCSQPYNVLIFDKRGETQVYEKR